MAKHKKRKKLIIKSSQSLHLRSPSSPDLPIDSSPSTSLESCSIDLAGTINLLSYQQNKFINIPIASHDALFYHLEQMASLQARQPNQLIWLDIRSDQQNQLIRRLQTLFPIEPITIENLVDDDLRTKLEDFDDYGFLSLHIFYQNAARVDTPRLFHTARIAMLIGDWYVITFQHAEHDTFMSERTRLISSYRKALPQIRSDFLLYFLLDTLVDEYFDLLEITGGEIDHLSEHLFRSYQPNIIEQLYALNQYVFLIRREIMPLSEVLILLKNGLSVFNDEASKSYFGNTSDHLLQLIVNLNFHRDSLANLMNLYYSLSDQKLNQIMKTLTVVSTIFIPLTFIVGVYGMNFSVMPELEWRYGYAAVWMGMLAVSAIIMLFMRRKKWL
jgi:magnesium transporter